MTTNNLFLSERPTELWQRRWNALSSTIDNLVNAIDAEDLSNLTGEIYHASNPMNIRRLLNRLKAWGDSQLYFLYHGFIGDKGYIFEVPTEKDGDIYLKYGGGSSLHDYQEFVLSRTIDQLAYDILMLQLALSQRTHINKDFLSITDILAHAALEMFEDRDIDLYTNAITYFRNVPAMRVIPYAHVPIIGIPLTANGNIIQDILSIPHEVGHLLYWKGLDITSSGPSALETYSLSPREQLQFLITPYDFKEWAEEIFADVIGTLIGGPIVALSAMEIALSHPPATFKPKTKAALLSDPHPAPYIRPLIYTYVIREHLYLPEVAAKLETHWREKVAQRKVSIEEEWFGRPLQIDPDPLAVDPNKVTIRNPIFNIIDAVFLIRTNSYQTYNDLLYWNQGETAQWSTGNGEICEWLPDFSENWDSFVTRLSEYINRPQTNPLGSDVPIDLWNDLSNEQRDDFWFVQLITYLPKRLHDAANHDTNDAGELVQTYLPPELMGIAANGNPPDGNPKKMSARLWLQVFEFGGWITEHGNSGGVSGQPYD